MFLQFRRMLIIIVCVALGGCGANQGRSPQSRPSPAASERRISLEIASVILRGNQDRNIILFLHKADQTTATSLTQYPEDQYIIMHPGDREDIQQSFVSMPESTSRDTDIVITVVSVPNEITRRIMNSIASVILDEITSKIPGNKLVGWIIGLASDELSNRLQEVIAGGEVIEMCEIKLNPEGTPTQTCNQNQQESIISIRQIVAVPQSVIDAEIVLPDGASPISVNNTPLFTDEDAVVNTVRLFNADQTIAMRNLELEVLQNTSKGQWLDWQKQYMRELEQENLYEVQQQLDFRVQSVKVDGDTATVVTYETWRTAKYDRSSHECRYHQSSFGTSQTYTLEQQGGVWKITRDIFEPDAPPDVGGC